jgi:hypothetical protein
MLMGEQIVLILELSINKKKKKWVKKNENQPIFVLNLIKVVLKSK